MIANIQNISKEELLAFCDKYIHPSSPHRSVLSVQVKSQIESKPPDFAQKLAEGIKQFIAKEGYEISDTEVAETLKHEMSLIPQALFAAIVKHGYDKGRVAASMTRGADILKAQAAHANSAGQDSGRRSVLKEVRVDDIKSFRSTLPMGEKPSPTVPLETFYELESPKL